MVGPIRFDGLSSGLNYSDIIDKLLSIERRPIVQYQNRIAQTTDKKAAFLGVSARLLAFKGAADVLARPSFFNRTKAASSNENVLLASGDAIATTGAFNFTVKRLAQTHQLISNGFSSSTAVVAPAGGTMTFELGGGYLNKSTPVSMLRGLTGIDRGAIRITDSSGKVGVVDLEGSLTVQDIVDTINSSTQVNVRASVAGDRMILEDLAGGAPGNFKVEDYGLDTTASDLGIDGTGASVGGRTYIFGKDINYLDSSTSLAVLNDGLGVRHNSDGVKDVRITDTDGVSFDVDVRSTDSTVQGVIDAVNTAATAATSSLRASLTADKTGIQLYDSSGANGVTVSGINGSLAAVDLGWGIISGTAFVQVSAEDTTTGAVSATGNRIVGNRLIASLNSTLRNYLNGGMDTAAPAGDVKGVRDGSIRITDMQGDNVELNTSQRIQTTLASSVSSGATSISVASTDGFAVGNEFRIAGDGGVQYRTVTRISGTTVFFDRALDVGFNNGRAVYAMNHSVSDILNLMNDRVSVSGVNVTASINSAGNGIQIRDTSNGTGSLSVSGVGGSFAASDLGISATLSTPILNGSDLDPQYVGLSTQLASLNQGKGVFAGKFRITDTQGKIINVDLRQSDDTDVKNVIDEINAGAAIASSGVVARINDSGDGILIEDTTPGAGTLRVSELDGGSTARDLNIAGSAPSASPEKIDGSYEYRVTLASGATLKDVAQAINDRGIAVTATVLNDGNPINPYKLSVLSKLTGSMGRITTGGDLSSLTFSTTTPPQDAILLYGSNGGATDPMLITSSSNTIKDVVPGMTLDLRGTSAGPVTVTVSHDLDVITDQVRRFVDTYNGAVNEIGKQTAYDPKTFEGGPLFTESLVRSIERSLGDTVTFPVKEILSGNLNNLGALGIKLVQDGKMSFDDSTFRDALNTQFDQVRDLFTYQRRLTVGALVKDTNSGRGVSEVAGNDFRIYLRDATDHFDIDLSGATTIGTVLNRINFAPGNNGKVTASIAADGFSLQLTDSTTPATRTLEAPATTSTFTESDFAGAGYADGFFKGATVTILSGPNQGEVRTVSNFNGTTGLVTLDSPLSSALTAGTSYRIERSVEVTVLNDSPAATQLGLKKKADLGANLLKGNLLNLNKDPGIAFRISESMDLITRPDDVGLISSRVKGMDDNIDGLNETIKRLEDRIKMMEERMVHQFTQLEQFLSESKGTMSRLQTQLGGLLSGFGTKR